MDVMDDYDVHYVPH